MKSNNRIIKYYSTHLLRAHARDGVCDLNNDEISALPGRVAALGERVGGRREVVQQLLQVLCDCVLCIVWSPAKVASGSYSVQNVQQLK